MRRACLLILSITACWHDDGRAPAPPVAARAQPAPVDLSSATYDVSFEDVFRATFAATRDRYPNLEEDPTRRTITTAWHQFAPPIPAEGQRYFARLDIALDGPPWAIHVTGRVQEWIPGDAMPHELTGPETAWLAPTIASLRAEIDRTLRRQRFK